MKKYTYTVIIFLFFLTFISSFNVKYDAGYVFKEIDEYIIYNLEYENGLTIDRYIDLFSNIDINDYYIININLDKLYIGNVGDSISRIELTKGDYLGAINEYVYEYMKILYLNNLEGDIDNIYKKNVSIKSIYIRCKEYVYNMIKD